MTFPADDGTISSKTDAGGPRLNIRESHVGLALHSTHDASYTDLIREYRLTIQGRASESDTDCDPLLSSASSLQGYGTNNDTAIFRQDTSCTESEDEKTKKKTAPLEHQTNTTHKLFPSFLVMDSYTDLQRIPALDDFYYNNSAMLSSQKLKMNNSSQENFGDLANSKKKRNSSVVTIFTIWNTTMGSSLLAMAWGINKSGLFSGILINIAIASLCLYTAYTILKINEKHGVADQNVEVPELCQLLIGRWAEMLAKFFSIIVLIGANVVYWILMSNFLYHSVYLVYDIVNGIEPTEKLTDSLICLKDVLYNKSNLSSINITPTTESSAFQKIWDLYTTVPIILGIVMFPFLNFKSPTFFTKFNSFGTLSIVYLIIFVINKSFEWGINIQNWWTEIYIKNTFFALSGMLSLSYFIHNIIISIMRHNKEPKHNGRDLIIAFVLITVTYLLTGVVFYICFPLEKFCIEDNILNNFSERDTMAIIARILLLFQLFTVFPLISFMLRTDILTNIAIICKNKTFRDFNYGKVIGINLIILLICIAFACFLPKIGTLIRYTGALSGMVYIFLLPNLLKIVSLKKEKLLTYPKLFMHTCIIVIGLINLVCQFFIQDT